MTTLSFTKNATTGRYECEYTGESGALQMVCPTGTKVYVSGKAVAAAGYYMLEGGMIEGANILRYLNMTGLVSTKIETTQEPTLAVVNS